MTLKYKFILIISLLVPLSSSVEAQNSKWVMTMTKESGYNGQQWRTKTIFPKQEIVELWQKDLKITSLTYGEGKWALIMSKGTGYGNQKWIINKSFPDSNIKILLKAGYKITNLTFGENKWVTVMSLNTQYSKQFWIIKDTFSTDEVKNFMSKGYRVTSVAQGNGKHIFIMSLGANYGKQFISNTNDIPVKGIKKLWGKKLSISDYSYDRNKWKFVFSRETGYGLQAVVIRGYFPKNEIKELWSEGYRITNLNYGICSYDNTVFEPVKTEVTAVEPIYKPIKIDTNTSIDSTAPNIWAVIVGIAKYNHVESLNYSDDDAYQTYAFFKSPEGGALADDHIQILIDEAATKEKILRALNNIFYRAQKKDVIIFYFSGHGIENAFLPYNYNGTSNTLLHSEIVNALQNSPARHKICIADACHSGSLEKGYRDLRSGITELYKAFNSSYGGLALMMSSKAEEISIEFSGLRQGVFSYYLIKGLKGEADQNKNRIITISEIFNYVQNGVKNYTKHNQNPVLNGSFDNNMPVGVVR